MNYNLLIVDDESAIRGSLSAFLEDFGFRVITADSSEKGLEILKLHKIDLCIVDMRLPGISGIDLIFQVYDLYPGMKYIINTGSLEFKFNEEILTFENVSNKIFEKPIVNLMELFEEIRSMLNIKE